MGKCAVNRGINAAKISIYPNCGTGSINKVDVGCMNFALHSLLGPTQYITFLVTARIDMDGMAVIFDAFVFVK